jgi:sulfite reductase beta subunit-like hemoprotein
LHGLLENDICDIGNITQVLSDMFRKAGKELSNLPRKFKTTVSACPLHCHQPQINDIGVFGVRHPDGRGGLGVMVGGGLSSTPHFGQGLRVFIPEADIHRLLPDVFYHIACIFRDADELRYKRKRARLKFLVADRGWQWFRNELESRLGYQLEHCDEIVNPRGALHTDHMGIGKLKNGLQYVGIPIERGRTSGTALQKIADLVDKYAATGMGEIRLSQKQNILLPNILPANVPALVSELKAIGLDPNAPLWRHNLLSCTGTQFCNLAVVETKQRAKGILEYLEQEVELDSPIMLSVTGCPNACAQYQVADIGLTGTKAIVNGEKLDAYDLYVGGRLGDKPEFGEELLQKVPTTVVHKVIGQLVRGYKSNRLVTTDGDIEPFRDFVSRVDLADLKALSVIPDWTPPPPRKGRKTEEAEA